MLYLKCCQEGHIQLHKESLRRFFHVLYWLNRCSRFMIKSKHLTFLDTQYIFMFYCIIFTGFQQFFLKIAINLFKYALNNMGDKQPPCFTPLEIWL